MIRDRRLWIVFALILVFFLQGLFLIQDTSPTTDEVAFHMVSGYVCLMTRDFRISPANPPLIREWMALPWLAIRPKLDLNKASWRNADSVPFATEFFYKDNRDVADALLYSSRFMILLLGTALAALIYIWSKALYGVWGGIVSLALYTFSPSFLAHSALANIDAGSAFFFTLAAYFLYRYLENGSGSDLFLLSFGLGLSFAAKTNTLFFGPVFLAAIIFKKGFSGFLKALPIIAVTVFFVIWGIHLFELKPLLEGGVPRVQEKLGFISSISQAVAPNNGAVRDFLLNTALHWPIPMPSYFLGIAGILRHHTASTNLHYAFGQWTTTHFWFQYFFLFLVKMPISFILILTMRASSTKKPPAVETDRLLASENAVLLWPAMAYFTVMCFEKTANGSRYLFPAICLLMVWAGGVAAPHLVRSSKKWVTAIILLLSLNAASDALAFPNYLSYFNELAGGHGYRYVRDSDVDWGQGLKHLKSAMESRGIDRVTLQYFGTADPSFYGIAYEPFGEEDQKRPGKKVYAVSLSHLDFYPWVAAAAPTAAVGNSIFLYDFRGKGQS